MAITAAQKAKLNRMNRTAYDVQLGTLIENAESVVAGEIALADGKVLIGNGSGVAAANTLSGDVTVSNAGVTAIGANKVTKAMLASAITPSHVVVYAGEFTTVGGDADEAITVTGAAGTDLVLVSLKTKGSTPRTILTAAAATNAINIVMSGDPSTDHVITYMVLRATA